jgi:hypothetical protein
MTNFTPNAAPTVNKNTSAEPPSDEQMLKRLDEVMPQLRVFLIGQKLERENPSLLSRVPPELRDRLQKGDPTVLPELLRTQPELFRDNRLAMLEDEAFRQLLNRPAESPQEPSESLSEPLPA